MSAMCGIFNKDSSLVPEHLASRMMNKLKVYPIDKAGILVNKGVFLGCGLQYITPESKIEELPFYDKNKGITITADAIIDNREELIDIFNISKELINYVTDSQLILMSYDKWGEDCPKYLIGDFTFAIWDEKKNQLFCARDHTGTRTFYYYDSKESFAFCTIINPLLVVLDDKILLNEKWITDFLALPLTLSQCECSETIYENIHELAPATSLTISDKGIFKNKYWDPLSNIKVSRHKDDKFYEEEFRKVFSEAVRCRLRSSGEVGIMLSGGMDSGSVACVAAKQLDKVNKNLKAYSSIPMEGYETKNSKYEIVDESEYIDSIKKENKNIDLTYCRNEGKNSLSDMKKILDIFEQPHKIVENMFWYNGIMSLAASENCKVILNGQFGNLTISYGDFMTHISTLYGKKKLLSIVKEILSYGKVRNVSTKKLSEYVFKAMLPYKLKKLVSVTIRKKPNLFSSNLVNKKLADKWNIKQRFLHNGYYNEVGKFYNINESKRFMMDPVLFSQMASFETRFSMAYGMVERDPTRDKRVIEFCLSVPSEQFVRNGEDRYLIRRALEGILPDKIRLNIVTRGLQSADWIERLEVDWEDIHLKMQDLLKDDNIAKYVDMDLLKKDLSEIGKTAVESNKSAIRNILVIYIFSEFLKIYINKD